MNYLRYNELRHSDLHNIIKVLTDSSILPKKCFFLKKNSTENVSIQAQKILKILFSQSLFSMLWRAQMN